MIINEWMAYLDNKWINKRFLAVYFATIIVEWLRCLPVKLFMAGMKTSSARWTASAAAALRAMTRRFPCLRPPNSEPSSKRHASWHNQQKCKKKASLIQKRSARSRENEWMYANTLMNWPSARRCNGSASSTLQLHSRMMSSRTASSSSASRVSSEQHTRSMISMPHDDGWLHANCSGK